MKPFTALLLLAGVACSDISANSGGAVALEIRLPVPALVEPGDTTRLHARALNQAGDSIPATITWLTPDTAALALFGDSVTARLPAGTARVQASVGSLVSEFATLTLNPHADSLVVPGPDTVRVAFGVDTSAWLVAQLQTTNPTAGVPGGRLIYEIVDPVFPTPTDRTVELTGGVLIKQVSTDSTGAPTPPVVVQRVTGTIAPDSVLVEVRWSRPSGTAVPGSPHRFTVRFDNQ